MEGLFADSAIGDAADEDVFASEAKGWAAEARQAQFRGHNAGEYNEAKDLAEKYFKAGTSEVHSDRYHLSLLVATPALSKEQKQEITHLCDLYDVGCKQALTNPWEVEVNKDTLPMFRNATDNDRVARWLALMLSVRVEQWRRRCLPATLQIETFLEQHKRNLRAPHY